MENDDGTRAWSKDLRAEPKRRYGRQSSRWLMEEGGGSSVEQGRRQRYGAFNGDDEQVDPTQTNNPSSNQNLNQQNTEQQSLLSHNLASSVPLDRQNLA
ncbi:hypothetical protein QL285_010572 [Trifolium repens]|nr:hypothetical protein QL285_010572 [Trifolium repens]